jgi:hypothetical protein
MESSVIAYICDAAVETTRMVGANAYKVYRLDKQGDVALEHLFPSTTHLTPPPHSPYKAGMSWSRYAPIHSHSTCRTFPPTPPTVFNE